MNGGGLQWAAGTTTDISSRLVLGGTNATFDTDGNNITFASALGGIGGITKAGTGILTLGATNTYTGGTTMTGGLINFLGLQFRRRQRSRSTAAGCSGRRAAPSTSPPSGAAGRGRRHLRHQRQQRHLRDRPHGAGGLTKQGTASLNLAGNNTYTGRTSVLAGTLAVNGSVASNVTVGPAGTLGGNGTICGNWSNAGKLAPGNSIGTLNINGNFVQAAGGTYQVEANAAGQADRINATGAAAIQGGTVQVLAQPGDYANSTTYTILRATGGVSGVYSGVTSNFAFLTPTLLRRQRRVPHLGARPDRLHAELPGADAQPEGGRRRAQPELRHGQRRLRHGAGRDRRPQHRAGPAGAEHDQRRALCRLRHPEHQQQHDVHECAGPADGQCARRGERRPAPGAGPGLRDRGLRWRRVR